MSGRFAPSPTGDLHLGNLRTALLAWVAARASGRGFVVRMEDLDRVTSSPESARRQLADLAALGLDWDGPVLFQSARFAVYRAAIDRLTADGRVYPCFCTRREIRAEVAAAAAAPHTPAGAYPGTCRDLTAAERAARTASGRPYALRLRAEGERIAFVDAIAGPFEGSADDVVLARADGVPAYNLAVVVDDAAQGITQVVRGDDLLASTPRQILLQRLLGYPHPEYAHVPLVVDAHGARLAKRAGAANTAVTLADLAAAGWSPAEVAAALARSLGLGAEPGASSSPSTDELYAVFASAGFAAIRRDRPVLHEIATKTLPNR
jgi:glutamyl-tRNA synthetase